MKVSELIAILKDLPQDIEVEVNYIRSGEVYSVTEVHHYIPNKDLWPDDNESVVLQVNS